MKTPRSAYDKITDSRRRYVIAGIRLSEPKASEIEKQIKVIAKHHGDKTTGVLAAVDREYKRLQGKG